jgi:ribosomal protein S18 acetylase RimI-like enzyme
LKTGDSGADASAQFDDPKIIGHVYAGPYVVMEPQSAFVLVDDDGVCGYVLGALDSGSFYDRVRDEWLPRIRKEYTQPEGSPEQWTRAQRLVNMLFEPGEEELFPEYPSHLHIDLLARAQGKGMGQVMMDTLLQHLRDSGSPGVHLGMAVDNDRAYKFYVAYGFHELKRDEDTIFMGLAL